jgi:ribosome-binding factor A
MPRDYPRTLRIAEQVQRELAELIRVELKDPRVQMVTLTEVDVSPDYANAKVFFTVLGDSSEVAAVAAGLTHAAGFLRRELAHRLSLRSVPRLQFVHDESVERGVLLSRLIDSVSAPAKKTRKRR